MRVVFSFKETYLTAKGLEWQLLDATPAPEKGCYKSLLFSIKGKATDLGLEEGTIQWIGQSPYRPQHERKNFFIGLTLMAPPGEIRHDLEEVDIKRIRSSGPGGQNVNKVETGVVVTHKKTGITVKATEERSQKQNLALAMARIRRQLTQIEEDKTSNKKSEAWTEHNQLKRGDPVMTFKGERFSKEERP